MYLCFHMKMAKYILMLVICLAQATMIDAQVTCTIDAIVETDSHLWTLTTIEKDSVNLVVNWKVISKIPNTEINIDCEFVTLKDCSTMFETHPHNPINKWTIIMPDAYTTDSVRLVFPAIQDSTLSISVQLSPTIHVDSITISDSLWGILSHYRYVSPLYHHTPLINRKDSINYSDSLFRAGMDYYYKSNYNDAILSFKKCYAFDKLLDNYVPLSSFSKRMRYDHSKKWLARCYYMKGDESAAIKIDGNKFGSDYKLEPYDRKLTEKADSLYNILQTFLYEKNRKDDYINGCIEICRYDSIALGTSNHRYALSLYELGQAYSSHLLFSQAKKNYLNAYNVISNITNDNWLTHSILQELADIAYNEDDIVLALHYFERSLKIRRDEDLDFSKDFPLLSDYSVLANYYTKAGNWEKALQIEKAKMVYWGNRFLKESSEEINYLFALDSYAKTLSESGRYKEAYRIYNRLVAIDSSSKGDIYGKDSFLGTLLYNLRDYKNAIKHYKKSMENNPLADAANDSNNISLCYFAMGEHEKAIQIQKECIEKTDTTNLSYRRLHINNYSLYTTMLSNLANFYNLDKQYDSALAYEERSLALKEKYCPHSDGIAYSYLNMALSLGGKRQWKEAYKRALYAHDLFKKLRQKDFYHRSLIYLSKCAFNLHNYDILRKYISELQQSVSTDLLSTLQELTYDERSRYIEKYDDLLNRQIPMYAYYTKLDSLVSATFDAILMMKGALLQSENEVKNVIANSKDTSLTYLWEELQMDRYILSKQIERDSITRTLNVDSLQKVIAIREDSLIVKCKEYGEITQSMKLKWQDVREQLHSHDIAIEFMSFPINNDSVMYAALTIRKDSSIPKMSILFEKEQLIAIPDSSYYTQAFTYNLIWKPLQSELQGIKNIYFSPSGVLHKIGIEYLPEMENYNIYRLSSTRELVTMRKKRNGNNAVLYGGLDYYAKTDSTNTTKSIARINETFKERANVRGMGLRGGKEPLKRTKVEVDTIGNYLEKANWTCLLDTASLGTEESFKALSGKGINNLHIATHGFYYTLDEATTQNYDFLLLNNHLASAEDKSLTRSGLLMAGANHILEGDSIPDDVEDGILTAKEIADLDLRGLDLVVLSACQTGLGDISQGEGVFGLQRGFKKAGADTILMSLWEVNDTATQILMTQFYKNYLSGQSKRESLLSAQKYLREYDNGKFNDPKYWAAFIMLDGL